MRIRTGLFLKLSVLLFQTLFRSFFLHERMVPTRLHFRILPFHSKTSTFVIYVPFNVSGAEEAAV
jgi:hypothetical protein